MNAFRDIDALLRMVAREKEILKFLFTGRKAPALRQEEALGHGVVRILRNIGLSTQRNVIDLKRNIDSTYKNERDYALKRKRLEQLDVKREDIALWVKEAERVMGERPQGFFDDVAGEVKRQLTEAYHNLLELDRRLSAI